jgi:hypothetical protein
MTRRTKLILSLTCSAALIGAAFAAPVAEGGRKFTTTMTGAQECNASGTCNLGDPDGTGTAHITVNVGQQRVCWTITVNNIAAPTRGHIHHAAAGTAGAIVVPFFEATNVDLDGCTPESQPVDRDLLTDIVEHPEDYYVNVHNADFPAGAIRGQLSRGQQG